MSSSNFERLVGTSLTHGKKALAAAGTPEKLVATSSRCVRVLIKAMKSNTGIIAVGHSNAVTAANDKSEVGIQLDAAQSVEIPIDDPSKIWLDASVNADGVVYLIVGY